jgi:molybdopterin-containing oxidoreductase family membrane subunit
MPTSATDAALEEGRVLPPDQRFAAVPEQIAAIPLDYPLRRRWYVGFGISALLLLVMLISVGYLFAAGVGIWGINIPVNWGLAISNYVWWIGIGNAGTMISAALLLLSAQWRNSLNRFAEAMTLFAVFCAALYPVLHLGRPQFFYWLFPYPNTMNMWPQFRSPLEWDFFANVIYLAVSAIFFYVGMIPDLAIVRDRARRRSFQVFYGLLALGWRGSAVHWRRWRQAYLFVAALAVPLVVSVHSGVAMLFAVGPIAGWHTTIYPPYFVAGALFSGFGVVAMITVVLRHVFRLDSLIVERHLDILGKMIIASGLLTAYGYVMEAFTAWYSAEAFERATLLDRFTGTYAWSYWGAVGFNFVALQALWIRRVRVSPVGLFAISLSITIGMWLERYMIVVTALYRDYLPSSWHTYTASAWEWSLFAGTLGLFFFLFFLFVRFLPMISMFEVTEVLREERKEMRDG